MHDKPLPTVGTSSWRVRVDRSRKNIGVQYNTIHGLNHVLKVVAQALKTPAYGAIEIPQFCKYPLTSAALVVPEQVVNYDAKLRELLSKIDIMPNQDDVNIQRFINKRNNAAGFTASDVIRIEGKPQLTPTIQPDAVGNRVTLMSNDN